MNAARTFTPSSSSAPARSAPAPLACPACESDLADGEAYLNTIVPAERDPEGKARVDIVLECPECGAGWYAFVAVEDFLRNPISGEPHA